MVRVNQVVGWPHAQKRVWGARADGRGTGIIDPDSRSAARHHTIPRRDDGDVEVVFRPASERACLKIDDANQ